MRVTSGVRLMVVGSRGVYVRFGGRVLVVRTRGNRAIVVVAIVRLGAWVLKASIRVISISIRIQMRLASSMATPLDPGKILQHNREENWLETAVSIKFDV